MLFLYVMFALLGVRPVEAGYARYEVAPNAAGLGSICGKVPVPGGEISVSVQAGKVTVESTCAGVGVLIWKGERITIPACKGEKVVVTA